ncbi:MAG TPA: large-conductance mechanosensitive channel protein MscL [Saprospiraceae bacterium]|nr:large-conductance mechanosensitive channel protein MscL [Saprospiraceae bacterium]
MWKEFKAFIMRGNVLELAVAVIIAGAFGAIVKSFTADVIMPPIGLALGDVNFADLAYTLKAAEFNDAGEVLTEAVQVRYGAFIQTIIDFLIIAFVIFMIVRSYNKIQDRMKKKEEEQAPAPPPGPTAEDLLAEIRDLLKKDKN